MPSFRVRARSRARPGPLGQLDNADRCALEIGPNARTARRPDWPAEEARLAVLWSLHKQEVLAAWDGESFMPWAVMRFDVPAEARRPGPIRDELLRRGTIPPLNASLEDMTAPLAPASPKGPPVARRSPR